jgi:P-type Ca2+ transporter type 2C
MALTDPGLPGAACLDERPAWALSQAEVAGQQGVDPAMGLDPGTAAVRLQRDGPNEVPMHAPAPLWRSVVAQLRDTLVLVLLAAAVLTALTGDVVDTAVILLVVMVNTVLGVAQERRALSEVRALDALVAPTARVTRNGTDTWIPTRELVRGDVLQLAAGDVVGADARLMTSVQLQVDEALLTGESQPSARDATVISAGPATMADRWGMVHAGSTVLAGSGSSVVVATGTHTAIGQVALLVTGHRSPLTPLQRRLTVLGRQISLGAAVACLLFIA